jgi:putative holliday junction resolvase
MGRILAIDYGVKRTGIAVTDPLRIIATGLLTIETENLLNFLKEYSVKEKVDLFVLGYPLNLDGTSTHGTEPVTRFRKKLETEFPAIPVDYEDERYTSKLAVEAMVQGGVSKKHRRDKSLIDKVSATIILQAYLERTDT